MINIKNGEFFRTLNRPFFLFFISMLAFHFFCMGQPFGDDIEYAQDYTVFFEGTFWEAVGWRYNTWSSRIFCDWVVYFFAHGHFQLWKVINSLICVLMVWCIYKIFSKTCMIDNDIYKWVVIILFCIYPLQDMSSAGWMATTINYLWNYAALLYFCVGLCRVVLREKILPWEYVLYFIAMLISINFEQTVLYVFSLCTIWLCWCIAKREKIAIPSMLFFVVLVGLSVIAFSPGNKIRLASEIGTWYPYYPMLSFFDKVNLGLNSTMFYFANDLLGLYGVFWLQVLLYVWCCHKNAIYKLYSLIPIVIIIIMKNLPIENNGLPYLKNFQEINSFNMTIISAYLPLFLSLILSLWPCILLYIIFKDELTKYYLLLYVYLISMSARVIMGFSPTVYASNLRTFLPVFLALIIINLFLYKKLKDSLNVYVLRIWLGILTLAATMSFTKLILFINNSQNFLDG